MSQRLSCLSTDFGLHLIRTIAGFISSMFVCRLNESSYKDSSSSYPSSPSSSFSSSQSSPVLFTLTSQPPKSFILKSSSSSSPNDEKQRKHRQKRCQHKSFKSTENGDENYCDDYQTSEEYANEDTVGDQTTGDRTVIDQNPPPRQMEKRLKVTEKELSYLNHKIEKLLVKLEEEYETEIAATPDEECVICISAKATMQTFPCAHRVVCRKCFVKTIQMVVSQRMLPLRCVICRAKVLRLKQTTTGGLSTGYVRSNSKLSPHFQCLQQTSPLPLPPQHSSGTLSRPVSLVPSAGCPNKFCAIALMHCSPAYATTSSCSTPPSPLTEVFQAQRALYELQTGARFSELVLRSSNGQGDLNCTSAGTSNGHAESETELLGQLDNGQRQQSRLVDHSRAESGQLLRTSKQSIPALQSTLAHSRSTENDGHQLVNCCDYRYGWESGDQATLSQSMSTKQNVPHSFCLCARMSAANSVVHTGQWVDSPTVTQSPSSGSFELESELPANALPCSANNDTSDDDQQDSISPGSVFNYLPQWCFVVHRKRKHARYLQHRRWLSIKSPSSPLPHSSVPPQPIPSYAQQQQQLLLPDNANFQKPTQTEQLEDLGLRQGASSFLVPIVEEDEDKDEEEASSSETENDDDHHHHQSKPPDIASLSKSSFINSISNIQYESNTPTTPTSIRLSTSSHHLSIGATASNPSYQSQSTLCSSSASASLQSINADQSLSQTSSNIRHSRTSLRQQTKSRIRKSRSESFLQQQYLRLGNDDDEEEDETNIDHLYQDEEDCDETNEEIIKQNRKLSDQQTKTIVNSNGSRFRSPFRASSLTSLLSSTIQEWKHFRSRISLVSKRSSNEHRGGSTVQYSNVSLSGYHLTQ